MVFDKTPKRKTPLKPITKKKVTRKTPAKKTIKSTTKKVVVSKTSVKKVVKPVIIKDNEFDKKFRALKKPLTELLAESKKVKDMINKHEYLDLLDEICKDIQSFGLLMKSNGDK